MIALKVSVTSEKVVQMHSMHAVFCQCRKVAYGHRYGAVYTDYICVVRYKKDVYLFLSIPASHWLAICVEFSLFECDVVLRNRVTSIYVNLNQFFYSAQCSHATACNLASK